MSLKRKQYLDRILEIFSYIKSQVELSTSGNLTDINIYSENFYRDCLNLIFGYQLENINIIEPNAAAIDLGDEKNKIAIQVTSSGALSKVKKTVKKFNDKNLGSKYNRLIILNISMKKKHKAQVVGEKDQHQLDIANDIWDISDLMNEISNKSIEEITEIKEFIEAQTVFSGTESIAKEIKTFQALISMLSDDNHPGVGHSFVDEPDPTGKIEERFYHHTDYLKGEFKDLYSEYGGVLADVFANEQLGHVQIRRLRIHLRTDSDRILTECRGDAREALQRLVSEFSSRLEASGVDYDISAVRFFLIDELIRCNVFPNKEACDV